MIQALASIGAALSIFLLLILLAKRPVRTSDLWLAVWFLAQAIFFVSVLVGLTAQPRVALAALVAGQFAIWTTGPAHYLYAATALGARHRLAPHAAFVAIGALVIVALPLAVPVRAEAGALVTELKNPWLLAVPLARPSLASLYPLAVFRMVKRRRQELKDQVADLGPLDPQWLQVWAAAILVVNAGLLLLFVNSVVASWPVTLQVSAVMAMQVAHIAYVGQRGLTRPGVFFTAAPVVHPRPARPPVDHLKAAEDYSRLQELFIRDKPHLLPNLTAEMLADRLGWGPERLTDALRHGGDLNFFDAVNAARVREVQHLALKPENADTSLLVLAHEAGFGSKTAFYDAFRRHAGCTPAAWRRRQTAR